LPALAVPRRPILDGFGRPESAPRASAVRPASQGARKPCRLKISEEIVIMSSFIEQIHAKAKTSPRKVVLQEGEDVRIIEAAVLATKHAIAEITLLGAPDKIKATAARPRSRSTRSTSWT
jgi:hypothetical protein